MRRISNIIITLLIFYSAVLAQEKNANQYGLYVIDDPQEYITLVTEDSSKMLVNLEEYIPGLEIDVRYATTNNFLGRQVYPEAKVYARLAAAEALNKVQSELKRQNLELKIFDAYRPYSVTVQMYETYGDTTYVASAWTGSRHNRGCAIDLTIISSETGEEIEMPTPYDDFTEKAHDGYMDLAEDVIKNRELLKSLMEKNG